MFLFSLFLWCPCLAINVSVQYNGGLLPDIILLIQWLYHRGTRLNAIKNHHRRHCQCFMVAEDLDRKIKKRSLINHSLFLLYTLISKDEKIKIVEGGNRTIVDVTVSVLR